MGRPRWRKGKPSGVKHSMGRHAHAAVAMAVPLLLACQAAGEILQQHSELV